MVVSRKLISIIPSPHFRLIISCRSSRQNDQHKTLSSGNFALSLIFYNFSCRNHKNKFCNYNSNLTRSVMTSAVNSNSKDKDHLEVTKDQCRSSSAHEVVVERMNQLSPTVKHLQLRVKGQNPNDAASFYFIPGQWLDVFIPDVKTVGGFSITSTPLQLRNNGSIDLAVKYSTWPPAHWVHTQCTEGSSLTIRSGGDFILPCDPSGDYLFIAGGVGINPIASMIFHLHDVHYKFKIKLLYTAKTIQELIFKDRFDSLAKTNANFEVEYYTTETAEAEKSAVANGVHPDEKHSKSTLEPEPKRRRMNQEDISKAVSNTTSSIFVCGPPPLIQLTTDTQTQLCQHRNVEVKFEKWWM